MVNVRRAANQGFSRGHLVGGARERKDGGGAVADAEEEEEGMNEFTTTGKA